MTKYRVRQITDDKFIAEYRDWFIWCSCWRHYWYSGDSAPVTYKTSKEAQCACHRHWYEKKHRKFKRYPKTVWSMEQ